LGDSAVKSLYPAASAASARRQIPEYTPLIPGATAFALDEPHPAPQNLGLVATSPKHDAPTIDQAIERVASAIVRRHARTPHLLLLGIANGGIVLARRLADRLTKAGLTAGLGTIDISFHRDDISRHPIPKEFSPTVITHDVNGATVILVDDVLYSGRTVKAALSELFDHGRPASVELAVLVDRGGRKLPVAADYCGLTLQATDHEKVVVTLGDKISSSDAVTVLSANRKSAI
jgi:pyrimidine operon attenuation protein/uracil phosphoribosyltransferase